MRRLRPMLALAALFAIALLPPHRAALAATGQVSFITALHTAAPGTTNSTTYFNGFTNGVTPWQTAAESTNEGVFGGVGPYTLRNFTVKLNTAPNPGQYVFTIRKNEADTALTVTIAGSATQATDSTHSASFSPGDRLSVTAVPTASAIAPGNQAFVVKVTSATANDQPVMWSSAQTHTEAASATYFVNPSHSGIGGNGGAVGDQTAVIPTAGTIDKLYVDCDADPGNGGTIVVTLEKASSGGTPADSALTCTVTGNGGSPGVRTASDTTHSVAVVAGDLVSFKFATNASTTTLPRARFGYRFSPTVASESIFLVCSSPFAQNTNTFAWNSGAQQTTQANMQALVLAATVKKLYCDTSSRTVGGSAQSVTLTADKNSSGQAMTLTFSTGGASAASDTSDTFTVADLDAMDFHLVSSATTGLTGPRWGVVFDVTQPASDPTGLLLRGVGSRPRPVPFGFSRTLN